MLRGRGLYAGMVNRVRVQIDACLSPKSRHRGTTNCDARSCADYQIFQQVQLSSGPRDLEDDDVEILGPLENLFQDYLNVKMGERNHTFKRWDHKAGISNEP